MNIQDFKYLSKIVMGRDINDAEKLKLIMEAMELLQPDIIASPVVRREPYDHVFIPANPFPWQPAVAPPFEITCESFTVTAELAKVISD